MNRAPSVLVCLAVLIYGLTNPIFNDDAYISFRYARNLAGGEGFVFNPGERIQGATSPLWVIVLAGGTRCGPDVVAVARWLSALALAGACLCLALIIAPLWGEWAAAAAAAALGFHPEIHDFWGNEIPLFLWVLLAAVLLYQKGRWVWAGVVAGLLFMARGEGVLLPAILCLGLVWRDRSEFRWRKPWASPAVRLALAAGIVIASWDLFSRLYFGAWFPITLSRKILQGQYPLTWFGYGTGLVRILTLHVTGGLFRHAGWIAGPVLAIGWGAALWASRRSAAIRILLAFTALQLIGYAILGVPGNYRWYYAPVFLMETIGWGGCVGAAAGWAGKMPRLQTPYARAATAAVVALLALAPFLFPLRNPYYEARFKLYRHVAAAMKDCCTAQRTALCHEVGILGYYLPCRLYDAFGLVQAQLPSEGYPFDVFAQAANVRPDFIFIGYSVGSASFEIDAPGGRLDYRSVYMTPATMEFYQVFQRENAGTAAPAM